MVMKFPFYQFESYLSSLVEAEDVLSTLFRMGIVMGGVENHLTQGLDGLDWKLCQNDQKRQLQRSYRLTLIRLLD